MKRRRRDGEGRKQSASGAEPRQGGRRSGPGTSAGDRAGRRVPQGPAERPTGDQVDWRAFPPGGQHTAQRKSVGWGKRGAGSVDSGGRRRDQQKKVKIKRSV